MRYFAVPITTGVLQCVRGSLRTQVPTYTCILYYLLQIKTTTVGKKMPSTEINGVPIISFIKSTGARVVSKSVATAAVPGTIASSAEWLSSCRSCRIAAGRARYLAKDPFSDYKSTSLPTPAVKFIIRTARVR